MVDKAILTEPMGDVSVSEKDELNNSIEEIQQRLHELEASYLESATSSGFGSSPFTPVPTLSRKIEELKKTKAFPVTDPKSSSSRLPQIEPPKFDGGDLEGFSRDFLRWLRITNLINAEDSLKIDWFCQCSLPKVKKLVERVAEEEPDFKSFLSRIERLFPKIENDISIREQLLGTNVGKRINATRSGKPSY